MKIARYIIIAVSIIAVFIAGIFIFSGCMCQPKPYDNELDECFDFRWCMYANKDNPDKSVCYPYAQECRSLRRYVRCGDEKFRWPGQTEQNCWDKLNSK